MPQAKILIVEDEFIIAEMMKQALEAAGLGKCRHAGSVADAMRALDKGGWGAALLDIRLGGDFVFPVAEALHARGVPFAFCSGAADGSDIPESLAHAPFLQKPWPSGDLERITADLLELTNQPATTPL
jgi:DNA-binding NtrC family response regulator